MAMRAPDAFGFNSAAALPLPFDASDAEFYMAALRSLEFAASRPSCLLPTDPGSPRCSSSNDVPLQAPPLLPASPALPVSPAVGPGAPGLASDRGGSMSDHLPRFAALPAIAPALRVSTGHETSLLQSDRARDESVREDAASVPISACEDRNASIVSDRALPALWARRPTSAVAADDPTDVADSMLQLVTGGDEDSRKPSTNTAVVDHSRSDSLTGFHSALPTTVIASAPRALKDPVCPSDTSTAGGESLRTASTFTTRQRCHPGGSEAGLVPIVASVPATSTPARSPPTPSTPASSIAMMSLNMQRGMAASSPPCVLSRMAAREDVGPALTPAPPATPRARSPSTVRHGIASTSGVGAANAQPLVGALSFLGHVSNPFKTSTPTLATFRSAPSFGAGTEPLPEAPAPGVSAPQALHPTPPTGAPHSAHGRATSHGPSRSDDTTGRASTNAPMITHVSTAAGVSPPSPVPSRSMSPVSPLCDASSARRPDPLMRPDGLLAPPHAPQPPATSPSPGTSPRQHRNVGQFQFAMSVSSDAAPAAPTQSAPTGSDEPLSNGAAPRQQPRPTLPIDSPNPQAVDPVAVAGARAALERYRVALVAVVKAVSSPSFPPPVTVANIGESPAAARKGPQVSLCDAKDDLAAALLSVSPSVLRAARDDARTFSERKRTELKRERAAELRLGYDPTPCRIHEVVPGLFVGSYHAAVERDTLLERGVTHVVCLIGMEPRFPEAITYLTLMAEDTAGYDMHQHWPQTTAFIGDALRSGGTVFVHCGAGVSRAPSVAAAFLIDTLGIDSVTAVRMLRAVRKAVRPNAGFLTQLAEHAERS